MSVSVCVSVWGACPGNCFLQLRLFVSFTAWELSVFWARALPEIRQKSIKKSCELPRKAPSKGFDGGRFPYLINWSMDVFFFLTKPFGINGHEKQ